MIPVFPNRRQLEQLFQDLEDGSISSADYTRLMDHLRKDPAARRAYIEHMTVASGLHELAESWGVRHAETRNDSRDRRERRMLGRAFAAAAALVMLLSALAGVIVLRERNLPTVSIAEGVATSWRFESGGIGENGGFLPKTKMMVDRGSLEITTRSRSRIVIEGPASLEIHGPMATTLHDGSAWFDIAERDKGFTVGTPRVRVIDLGTRFGVAVARESDHIQVDSGLVRIVPRQLGLESLNLEGGKAVRANLVGRCTEVAYAPDAFMRKPAMTTLVAHWSFDDLENGVFPADPDAPELSPVRVAGFGGQTPSPRIVPGRFGRALDLTVGDAYAESDFPGIPGRAARTVAFWFRSQPIRRRVQANGADYTPAVLFWGDENAEGGNWTIRAHPVSGVIGTQWGTTAGHGWITSGKIGSINILDGKWHHIVSVYTGGTTDEGHPEVLHYINGELLAPRGRKNIPVSDVSGASHLRLGYDHYPPAGPVNTPLAIDELWIFRSALDEAAVRSLYEHNRIAPPSR